MKTTIEWKIFITAVCTLWFGGLAALCFFSFGWGAIAMFAALLIMGSEDRIEKYVPDERSNSYHIFIKDKDLSPEPKDERLKIFGELGD